MIPLKKSSLSSRLLFHRVLSSGRLRVSIEIHCDGRSARNHCGFAELIFIDQLKMSVEEPPHLVAEPRCYPSDAAVHP